MLANWNVPIFNKRDGIDHNSLFFYEPGKLIIAKYLVAIIKWTVNFNEWFMEDKNFTFLQLNFNDLKLNSYLIFYNKNHLWALHLVQLENPYVARLILGLYSLYERHIPPVRIAIYLWNKERGSTNFEFLICQKSHQCDIIGPIRWLIRTLTNFGPPLTFWDSFGLQASLRTPVLFEFDFRLLWMM